MNMDKLRNIPVESEEIFLRQRTDISVTNGSLAKPHGAISVTSARRHGTIGASRIGEPKWNAYGYSEDTIDYHDGDTLYSKRHGLRRTLSLKG